MDTQRGTSEITELVEDINRLFESIDIRTSARENLRKKAMKRPVRVDSCRASRIGITESTSLKQALRGLCISQASEMAAMKRLSKPPALSGGISEAVTITNLYRAVVLQANESGHLNHKSNFVEISLVPEKCSSNLSEPQTAKGSSILESSSAEKVKKAEIVQLTECQSLPMHDCRKNSRKTSSSVSTHKKEKLPVVDEIVPTSVQEKRDFPSPTANVTQSAGLAPKILKPIFRNRNLANKKSKLTSPSVASSIRQKNKRIGNDSENSSTNGSVGFSLSSDEKSRVREKGEFSQSSKSSIGEYSSSTTSFSEESSVSGSNRSGHRPHMSKDSRWEAILCIQKQHGTLGLRHFKLVKKLGGGDIGNVYLAELTGSKCLFALKVMDNEFLGQREKISRAHTELEILQLLDHPFLPTLFGHFRTDKYSCLVMEYCPGGDLHVLRQKQLNKCFSEQAVRFYVAELLLALEYLHMLGVVYRDLKPENVLVREDGHIMLTDFDLSFRCAPSQTFLKPSSPILESQKKVSNHICTNTSSIRPFCPQPSSWQVPCFTPNHLSAASKSRKLKNDLSTPLPQLVVEPTNARSNSYVGTHEYLAPEIIRGEGHGSPVDWWTLGILLYELLYGRTPFKGTRNTDTLTNVVSQTLKFPLNQNISSHAKDLIKGLLQKQPENRLGSVKGAVEIKGHPFFEGLNWALIRCAAPPELPRTYDLRSVSPAMNPLRLEIVKCEKELTCTGENLFLEMF